MDVSLIWVDAFTDGPFTGNPAGVCLLQGPVTVSYMQSLAAELGLAETAFVTRRSEGDGFDLRWFSPLVEIDLCGHATLAAAHTLRTGGVVDGGAPITFHTRSGPLVASFDGELVELDFPADPMTEIPLPAPLDGEWGEGVVLGAGRTAFFAIVILATEAAVRHYQPNLSAIAATDHQAVVLTAPAWSGSDADYDYVLRVFGPNVGIDEDAATGSAQCSIGPYWSAALGRPQVTARQVSPRGAVLRVRPDGDRVHIAGNAVTVFAGHLC